MPAQHRTNPLRAAAAKAWVRLLRQRAQLAQVRRDWPAAARLWQRCAEKAPDQFHNGAYVSALIYAGEIDAAARQAEAHVHQFPGDENGQVLLARIAEAKGELPQAIDHWRTALELRHGHRQSLVRLGAALLSLKRLNEAQASAGELLARYPREPHGPILQAQIAQEREGWAASAPLWRAAAARFSGDLSFLRVYGRALVAGGAYDEAVAVANRLTKLDLAESFRLRGQVLAKQQPYQDHTGFWQSASARLPDNADLCRKLVHAALWARRIETAETAFRRLLARHRVTANDAHFAVGLANASIDRGEKEGARRIIRHFMRAMRSQSAYHASALRLNRLILACFPRSAGAAHSISHDRSRFVRMVQNARLPASAADPLIQAATLEEILARKSTLTVLDSDIDPDSCRAFVRLVRNRLSSLTPFSLVRLGDGEANALQHETAFALQMEQDAAEREHVWWGRTLDSSAREELASRVRDSIFAADAVGVPTRERFLRDVRLSPGPPLSASRSGRGLLATEAFLRTQIGKEQFSEKLFVSARLPQDLQRWRLYGELLNGTGDIVVVSCHATLPDALHRMFDLRVAHHVLLPPGDSMREMQHRALSDDELPPRSTMHALADLGGWPEGRLVLVGAGYAGKVIVNEAKRRGGIALDLGSIFDRWLGLYTRSYQDLA